MSAPDQPLVPWRSQPGQTPDQRDVALARGEAKRGRRRERNLAQRRVA